MTKKAIWVLEKPTMALVQIVDSIHAAARFCYKQKHSYDRIWVQEFEGLCLAKLPYDLSTEESKYVSNNRPYGILESNGCNGKNNSLFKIVSRVSNKDELKKEIYKAIDKKGESYAIEIYPVIFFDITELIETHSNEGKKRVARNLIEKLGI